MARLHTRGPEVATPRRTAVLDGGRSGTVIIAQLDIGNDRFSLGRSRAPETAVGVAVPAQSGGLAKLPNEVDGSRRKSSWCRHTVQALKELVKAERLRRRGFSSLRFAVTTALTQAPTDCRDLAHLVNAMNGALICFPTPIECLSRSSALALLLKQHGFAAEVIIGVQTHPFVAHAWVEYKGSVVDDDPELGRYLARIDSW